MPLDTASPPPLGRAGDSRRSERPRHRFASLQAGRCARRRSPGTPPRTRSAASLPAASGSGCRSRLHQAQVRPHQDAAFVRSSSTRPVTGSGSRPSDSRTSLELVAARGADAFLHKPGDVEEHGISSIGGAARGGQRSAYRALFRLLSDAYNRQLAGRRGMPWPSSSPASRSSPPNPCAFASL